MGSREIRAREGSLSLGVAKGFRRRSRRRFVLVGALIVALAVTGASLDLTRKSDAMVLPDVVAANGRIALFDPTSSLLTSVKPDGSARRVLVPAAESGARVWVGEEPERVDHIRLAGVVLARYEPQRLRERDGAIEVAEPLAVISASRSYA